MRSATSFRAGLIACGALALVGVVSGMALASGGSSRHHRWEAWRLARAQRSAWVVTGNGHSLPAKLTRSFEVFKRGARPGAHTAAGPMGQFPGLPPDLISTWGLAVGDAAAIENNAGVNLWLVPGTSGTCFAYVTRTGVSGAGCVPNSMALAGELSPVLVSPVNDPTGEIVMGLAPNGNSTVTLTLANGAKQSAPVADNVYVVETPQHIATVSLRDSTGVLRSPAVPDGVPVP